MFPHPCIHGKDMLAGSLSFHQVNLATFWSMHSSLALELLEYIPVLGIMQLKHSSALHPFKPRTSKVDPPHKSTPLSSYPHPLITTHIPPLNPSHPIPSTPPPPSLPPPRKRLHTLLQRGRKPTHGRTHRLPRSSPTTTSTPNRWRELETRRHTRRRRKGQSTRHTRHRGSTVTGRGGGGRERWEGGHTAAAAGRGDEAWRLTAGHEGRGGHACCLGEKRGGKLVRWFLI